jgi:hypothetical protein
MAPCCNSRLLRQRRGVVDLCHAGLVTNEAVSVRAEGDFVGPLGFEGKEFLPRLRVPQLYRLVIRTSG